MSDTIRFGIIGCGLMAREFAGAAARWSQFVDPTIPRPEIVAVCSRSEKSRAWFTDRFSSINFSTPDYRELLARLFSLREQTATISGQIGRASCRERV